MMLKYLLLTLISLTYFACSNGPSEADKLRAAQKGNTEIVEKGDPKGIGEVRHVVLNDPLDEDLIKQGKGEYELKCAACHTLTEMRVVGPGWKGVTSRRTPEWIMNMTLNVDEMLDNDPGAKALLKDCLVRMPRQNLKTEEARAVLEFMLSNDAAGAVK